MPHTDLDLSTRRTTVTLVFLAQGHEGNRKFGRDFCLTTFVLVENRLQGLELRLSQPPFASYSLPSSSIRSSPILLVKAKTKRKPISK